MYYLCQGYTTFCYCRPHSLIYTKYGRQWVGVIFMRYFPVPTNIEHIQTNCVFILTLCDIIIQIVKHRVDWFSCLAFVLLQYTPTRPPNLVFRITCGLPQVSLSKVVHRWSTYMCGYPKTPSRTVVWPPLVWTNKMNKTCLFRRVQQWLIIPESSYKSISRRMALVQ